MPDTILPKPTNKVVSGIKLVLDFLIEGLGPDLAFAALLAENPWMAHPVAKFFIKSLLIDNLAEYFNDNAKIIISTLVIRYQNDVRKQEYEQAIAPIKKGKPSAEQIAAARAAARALIQRSK